MSDFIPFERFLADLLRKGKIKEGVVKTLTTEPYLSEFRRAFTHRSYDLHSNYDYFEFFGDTNINEFVVYKVRKQYPEVTSVRWLTRLKHTLVSGKILGVIAIQQNFQRYLLASPDTHALMTSRSLEDQRKFVGIMEDMLEAFCGCLVIQIQALGNRIGTGIELVHRILDVIYGDFRLPLVFEELFDPITRLKETYEMAELKRRGITWPMGEKPAHNTDQRKAFGIAKLPEGGYLVKVFGWPLGDQKVTRQNEIILAEVRVNDEKKEVKKIAANEALKVLKDRYGIFLKSPPLQD